MLNYVFQIIINYDSIDYKIVQNVCNTSLTVRSIKLIDKYEKWMDTHIKSKRKQWWIKGADFDIENITTFSDSDFLI